MISGPLLLIGLLLFAAAALYILRRFEPLAAAIASGLSLLIAIGLWRLPLTTPAILLGRPVNLGRPLTWEDISLQITPASRALLVFLFVTAAVTFILAWRTYQGRTFYPFGLLLLALWSVVVMLQPLTYTPMAVVLAAILSVFLIQAGRPGETHGAWRQLLFPTLAVPFFLVAAWYIDQAPLNPDDQTPYRIAGWLLIAGFVLLLQPAPLHVAVPGRRRAGAARGGRVPVDRRAGRDAVPAPALPGHLSLAERGRGQRELAAVARGVHRGAGRRLAATQRRLGRTGRLCHAV